jgi:peroxiredoxin
MSMGVYSALTIVLEIVALAALLGSLGYLIGALVRWRTAFRKRRFLRSAGLFAVMVAAIASQQFLLWCVFLPSFGRELREQARVAREERTGPSTLTRVGDAAPDLSVVADDGSMIDSARLKGKVVVLNFFATWCGPCLAELPHLQTLWDEYGMRDDFAMLVVGREETDEVVTEFKSRHGFTFPIAADPERTIYGRFATEFIPRTYLLSRDGTILFQTVGFEEIDKLKELLARELKRN